MRIDRRDVVTETNAVLTLRENLDKMAQEENKERGYLLSSLLFLLDFNIVVRVPLVFLVLVVHLVREGLRVLVAETVNQDRMVLQEFQFVDIILAEEMQV